MAGPAPSALATAFTDWFVGEAGGTLHEGAELVVDASGMGGCLRARASGGGLSEGAVAFRVPHSAVITLGLCRRSDAGRAVLCGGSPGDAFPHAEAIDAEHARLAALSGPELLADVARSRRAAAEAERAAPTRAAAPVSDRALLLAFLVQQRYCRAEGGDAAPPVPVVAGEGGSGGGGPRTFAPYARLLPAQFTLPILWAEAELRLLAACVCGAPLLRSVAALTRLLADDFVELRRRFGAGDGPGPAALRRVFGDGGGLTWARWLWASAAVSSRSFPAQCLGDGGAAADGGDVGVMVPLLDMLNHDPDTSHVQWVVEAGPGAAVAGAVVRRPVAAGDEVLSHYGADLSNTELVLNYGFAELHNRNATLGVGWGLADLPELHRTPAAARAVAAALGAGDAFADQLCAGGRLEFTLSHEAPLPATLLRTAEAAAGALGPATTAAEYLRTFLAAKRAKLLSNFDEGLSGRFGCRIARAEEGSVGHADNGGGGAAAPAEAGLDWAAFVERHSDAGAGVSVGETRYLTTVEGCVLALFDAQLLVLEHALAAARARGAREAGPPAGKRRRVGKRRRRGGHEPDQTDVA